MFNVRLLRNGWNDCADSERVLKGKEQSKSSESTLEMCKVETFLRFKSYVRYWNENLLCISASKGFVVDEPYSRTGRDLQRAPLRCPPSALLR